MWICPQESGSSGGASHFSALDGNVSQLRSLWAALTLEHLILMSLISTKGILAGAVLASAGALALGTTPAQAAACASTSTIGTFASPCELKGFSLKINSFTDPTLTIQTSGTDDGFFGLAQIGTKAAGNFNFTVTALPNTFFNFSDFILGSNVSSVVALPFFTFDSTGDQWTNTNNSITSITGVYNYNSTGPLSISSLKFTTEVPVPLPVVGAGLAFGFTRNLRKRAKSAA